MSMDSNKPYQRVNVQANNNDSIWNGAAWGAGAGVGALGLTYGATTFGARGVDTLAAKSAGSKMTRMQTRNDKRMEAGKSHLTEFGLSEKREKILNRQIGIHSAMGRAQGVGSMIGGSKKRMVASAATGLMGGMLAGAGIDHLK